MNTIQEQWIWEAPCPSRYENAKTEWIDSQVREVCASIAKRGEQADRDIYTMIFEHIEDNLDRGAGDYE